MLHRRNHHLVMAAFGLAMSAGAAAVASAVDTTEKFIVTGALKVTHVFTEQVCDFDTLDQLEAYLAGVADRHDWFRHDQPAAAPLTDDAGQLAAPMSLSAIVGDTTTTVTSATALDQIDTTAAQVDTLAKPVDTTAGPAPAPAIEPAPSTDPQPEWIANATAPAADAAAANDVAASTGDTTGDVPAA